MNIDIRSASLGLIAGASAVALLGAGDQSGNRYQATSSNGVVAVLDTETGKVWYSNLNRPGYVGESPGFWEPKK